MIHIRFTILFILCYWHLQRGVHSLLLLITQYAPGVIAVALFNLSVVFFIMAYQCRSDRWGYHIIDLSPWTCFRFWRKKVSKKHRHSEII